MNKWFKILVVKALLLVGLSSFAQFEFQVVDETTFLPVEYASVQLADGRIFYTDTLGNVVCDSSFNYTISSLGFKTRVLSYSDIVEGHYRVLISDEVLELDAVVIESNSLTSYRINDGIRQKEGVNTNDVPASLSGTAPDILEQSGKVYVQKSQQGGGSPVLRGFEANRVLLLVDGVRMNNAIFRSGHLQNSTTIDPFMLEGIDVLFGPGSLSYGSDAIGGTVNFKTKESPFEDSVKFSGSVLARTGSADFEKTLGFSAVIRNKISVTDVVFRVSDYDDLRSGKNSNLFNDFKWLRTSYVERVGGKDTILENSNPYKQIGSGYGQLDFFVKHRRKQKNEQEHHLCLQVSTSTDVPRYDRLGNDGDKPEYARWDYGPQKRVLFYAKQIFGKSREVYDLLDVTFSLQRISESRINRRFQSDLRRVRKEDLLIGGLSASAFKGLGKYGEFQYGADTYFNKVFSEAYELNIKSSNVGELSTRYPSDGSNMFLGGVYVNHMIEKNKFQFHDGVRFDVVRSDFELDSTFNASGFSSVTQSNVALSAGLGMNYNANKWLSFVLNSQTAFRAPNIDDLSKVFDSNPGEVVIPNEDLKPERSLSVELLAKIKSDERFSFDAGVNWNRVFNLISVADFSFNGQDSIVYDEVLSRVSANQNNEFGNVYGAFYNMNIKLGTLTELNSNLTFTRGILDNGENMAHIPPVYGRTAFDFKFNETENTSVFFFVSRYNFNKPINRYSKQSADRLVFATPDGMPAYVVFDLLGRVKVKNWEINGGVKNLLDTHYRTFASGINASGRNFTVSGKLSF